MVSKSKKELSIFRTNGILIVAMIFPGGRACHLVSGMRRRI
jgi:hypothetical protein